jgi:dienelactone hydrolase
VRWADLHDGSLPAASTAQSNRYFDVFRWAVAALVVALLAVGGPPAFADPLDCTGPAGNPAPGTPDWYARELREARCGEQRVTDTASNPLFAAVGAQDLIRDGGVYEGDPFRDPSALTGHRFRYEKVGFTDPEGQKLDARLFLPCDGSCTAMPSRLRRFSPPYPAVVVVHGGSANQEMYWWGAEPLAEAGYMVLSFQVPTAENTGPTVFPADTEAAIDYLTSTPDARTAAGEVNPQWMDLDRARIGLAGHSAGGFAVSQVGQEDPRVSAIVSWDRAQSSPMRPDLPLRTPALFLTADYNCQKVPVCVPQPYTSPPDPLGPGDKDTDFQRLRAAGVDTMKVSLRAATHLDFTQFGIAGTGSRYGAATAEYYTLAWFDRYLRGSGKALRRLTATKFDDSEDIHNISGGTFDPLTRRNVPAFLAGQPVANRLSFHFRSAYFLDDGALRCEDIRAGCR